MTVARGTTVPRPSGSPRDVTWTPLRTGTDPTPARRALARRHERVVDAAFSVLVSGPQTERAPGGAGRSPRTTGRHRETATTARSGIVAALDATGEGIGRPGWSTTVTRTAAAGRPTPTPRIPWRRDVPTAGTTPGVAMARALLRVPTTDRTLPE